MKGWKIVTKVFCLTFLVFMLSGCYNFGHLRGGASISVDATGQLMVGECLGASTQTINVTMRRPPSNERFIVADGEGDHAFAAGEYYVLAQGIPGFNLRGKATIRFKPNDQIYVSFNGVEEGVFGVFTVPSRGLQPGVWLFPDGSMSDRVCGSYERQSGRTIPPIPPE